MSWQIIAVCDRCQDTKVFPWDHVSPKTYEEPGGCKTYTLCEECARRYNLLHAKLMGEMNDKKRRFLKGEDV